VPTVQLATEHGCHVYLGSRSVERGTAAVDSIKKENPSALVELVQVDVSSDESVNAAAATVQAKLGGEKLYALVNNVSPNPLRRERLCCNHMVRYCRVARGPQSSRNLSRQAGTGLAHGTDAQTQLQTNLYGPKRMVEAFLPLISSTEGRIVNVGSGAGPIFVGNEKCPLEVKKMLCSPDVTWEQIDTLCKGDGLSYDTMGG
jgi:carbonyl reductase 1